MSALLVMLLAELVIVVPPIGTGLVILIFRKLGENG